MEWFLSGCIAPAPGNSGFCCLSLKLEEQSEKTPHSAWGNERKIGALEPISCSRVNYLNVSISREQSEVLFNQNPVGSRKPLSALAVSCRTGESFKEVQDKRGLVLVVCWFFSPP